MSRAISGSRLRWYVLAVVSAAIALGTGCVGWWQVAQAHSIDARPVRVQGTVVRMPSGVATYSQIDYTVNGRHESAANLALPEGSGLGSRICLEVSAKSPSDARVCGQTYPQAVGVALARVAAPLGIVVLLLAVWRLRVIRRARLAAEPPRPRRRRRA